MIYADNASTTKVCRAAIEKMLPFLHEKYGNPISPNKCGEIAASELALAKAKMLSLLGLSGGNLIFTSGGSEANNQAVAIAERHAVKNRKKVFITTEIEHDSVYKPFLRLAERGFRVIFVKPDGNGVISPDEIKRHIDGDTAFVSVMTANNETGVLQPIKEISHICREHNVLFHTDAVQAVGKPVYGDMISISAHKFGGIKGIGALYLRDEADASPIILGGDQQNGLRGGTEPVPLIISMAAALEDHLCDYPEKEKKTASLRDLLEHSLSDIPNLIINGKSSKRLAGHSSISVKGINSDALLMLFDQAGICAAKGSACHSGDEKPSRVLQAMSVPAEYSLGTVRFSLNHENTYDEILYISETIKNAINKLRSFG